MSNLNSYCITAIPTHQEWPHHGSCITEFPLSANLIVLNNPPGSLAVGKGQKGIMAGIHGEGPGSSLPLPTGRAADTSAVIACLSLTSLLHPFPRWPAELCTPSRWSFSAWKRKPQESSWDLHMLECTRPLSYTPVLQLCLECQSQSVQFIVSREWLCHSSSGSPSWERRVQHWNALLDSLLTCPSVHECQAAQPPNSLSVSQVVGQDPDCLYLVSLSVGDWPFISPHLNYCSSFMGYMSCTFTLLLSFPYVFM